ncbi:hypothetical protein [Endozoicomonas sp. 2B-B]
MRYLFITLIPVIITGQAWSVGCNNCKFEINAASNFCPNCGFQISLQLLPTGRLRGEDSVARMAIGKNISSGISTNNKHNTSLHYHLRRLLERARKEGRFSALWRDIDYLCKFSEHKDDLFFLYAHAVALRNMGKLGQALSTLNTCLVKTKFSHPTNLRNLQIYYELSFVHSLMGNHNDAIHYYYLFFTNREDRGINQSTVNSAVNSAVIAITCNSENAEAYSLLLYCWKNLKQKINPDNLEKMRIYGFH